MTHSPLKPVAVCFICPKAYPLFNPACPATFGGAEVDFYLLATELAKDPHFAVRFIVADFGQPQTETLENVQLIKSLTFRENPLTGALKVWQTMKQTDADIYILETASLGVPLTALFCRIYKKHFVYRTASSRECDGRYLNENYWGGKLFWWGLRRAAQIFSQNNSDRIGLQKTTGLDSLVMPNAQPLSPAQDQSKQTILWVGRSETVKGPYRFLELAQAFPQEQFVMVCPPATGEQAYEPLKAKAASIANLQFHGRVHWRQAGQLFQQAKVFVNTSDSEGFPNAFIQACAAAAPILSYLVDPDGFLTQHNCGLACGGDMEKLKQGLRFILEQNRYIELGQNARRYAEQTHDIKKIIEQYKAAFRRIVERRD